MKIAVDCRMIGMSGIGVYIENIVNEFVNHYSDGYEFLLIGGQYDLSRYLKCPNVSVFYVNIPIFSLQELIHFPVEKINKCDIFYTPNFNIPGRIHIPVYVTIHDVIFLDVPGQVTWVGKNIRHWFLKRAVMKSEKVFTVSEFSKSRIRYHFPFAKDVIVTYNGIANCIREYKEDKEKEFQYSYILYVGNIKKHKGILTLLEAFQNAKCKGLKHQLVIVGGYQNFKTNDKKVSLYLQKENAGIKFTGKIDNNRLCNIIKHADCLVLPSKYEGFGLPPLEALFLGCPVLLSDIPVFKEIYNDFPINYFKVDDAEDLCQKLLDFDFHDCRFSKQEMRERIDRKYNFRAIAQKVLNSL